MAQERNQRYRQQGGQHQQQGHNLLQHFNPDWIKKGLDRDAVRFADKFGKIISHKFNGISTSQIRNVYGEMKRIQLKGFDNEKTAFLLLKPKLAYNAGRHKREGMQLFKEFFNKAYDLIEPGEKGKKQYENLMLLMEAILAYHKAYGGK